MSGVHVIIASYGSAEWERRGQLAALSARSQTVQPDWVTTLHVPGDAQIADVRNRAAQRHPEANWLIFLDADDSLHPGYVEAMLAGSADVRQPSTAGVHPDGSADEPSLIPHRDLLSGNYIVVGAMVHRDAFDAVGGFRPLPIYEDWDLWLRMEEYGCSFAPVPDATYYVTVRQDSRNNQAPEIQRHWFRQIQGSARARRGI
jgi:GT2 family glycosyltransferase